MADPFRDVTPDPAVDEPTPPARTPAEERFQSCRWRSDRDAGPPEHCVHRNVLPFAGANGFTADAWCPDCAHYKPRRVTKKRDADLDM